MRPFLRHTIGFAPESAAEWFALVVGSLFGFLVGFSAVMGLLAALEGN